MEIFHGETISYPLLTEVDTLIRPFSVVLYPKSFI